MASTRAVASARFGWAPNDILVIAQPKAGAVHWRKVWEEEAHPRDEHGRFASGGLDTADPTGSVYTVGQDLREIALLPSSQGRSDDPVSAALAAHLGYDAHPKIGTAAELEAVRQAGGVELFRGQKDAVYTEALRSGAYYAGQGVYTAGIYMAPQQAEAATYSNGEPDSVAHGVLAPDAKVGAFGDVEHQMLREYDAVQATYKSAVREAYRSDSDEAFEQAKAAADEWYSAVTPFYTDVGRYAMANGYDSLRCSDSVHLVLNRGALMIEEKA